MGRLDDKIAVITGSSRGIGATLARAFAREGAKVVITYRRAEEEADAVAAACGAELVLPLDVTRRASISLALAKVLDHYGRLDILVNNAGINITGDFDEISDEDWEAVLECDLKGVFLCCREALPHLSDDGGRIINLGSFSGECGGPRTPSFAAAKAGVISLTETLAQHVAPRGITVNCLSPGVIAGDLPDPTIPAFLQEKVLPLILVERLGRYEELEEAAIFLASPASAPITGQTIAVNGGAWVR